MKYPALANPWAEKADWWLREAGRRGTGKEWLVGYRVFFWYDIK